MAKANLRMSIIVAIAALLSGCSQQPEIESIIKENLLDPFSAQFKDFAISSDGNSACINWNAKNRMGGYGGWKIASLKKSEDKWSIYILEDTLSSCTKEKIDEWAAILKARNNAEAEAINIIITGLQKAKKLSIDDAQKAMTNECSTLAHNIRYHSKYIAEKKISGDSKDIERSEQILARNLNLLEKGDCARATLF